jgi:transcriptional regulator with XRE-family HTH domain
MEMLNLKHNRRARGWSQKRLAHRLGLSQPYVAMLESGQRRFTPRLAQKLRRVLRLPPTFRSPLAPSETPLVASPPQALAEQLAALGYPGFAYLRPRCWKRNPAEVLLAALALDELEARLVEALPWLLVRYWEMDPGWLLRQAKLSDLQNRLGFVVGLARRVAERATPRDELCLRQFAQLEATLEKSRLAREDTLCKTSMTTAERQYLREHRPQTAKRWNLLTDWVAEALPYVA